MALAVSPLVSSSLLPSNPPLTSLPWKNRGHVFHDSLERDSFRRRRPTIFSAETTGKQSVVEVNFSRKQLILLSLITFGSFPGCPSAYGKVSKVLFDEKRLLEQNRRIQEANNAPPDFPNFIREAFQVKVVTPEQYLTSDSGLIYLDLVVGKGDCPLPGQQVTFHYIGYNESGRRIDTTYGGNPARIRIATNALVPGFEEGISSMRPGGRRRIIIPPELGPPVGPSTFFSAKQFEVFDIELLSVQSCQRRTIGFYSDLVCN